MEALPTMVSLLMLDLRSIFLMHASWSFNLVLLILIVGILLSNNFAIFNPFFRAYMVPCWNHSKRERNKFRYISHILIEIKFNTAGREYKSELDRYVHGVS